MLIKNVELRDIDLTDYDDTVAFETAQEALLDKFKQFESSKPLKTSESIKAQCEIIFAFFDELFGTGTAKQIFGEKCNAMDAVVTYKDCVKTIQAADREKADKIKKMQLELKQPSAPTQKSDFRPPQHNHKKRKGYNR